MHRNNVEMVFVVPICGVLTKFKHQRERRYVVVFNVIPVCYFRIILLYIYIYIQQRYLIT